MARLTVSGHRSSQVLEDFVLVSLTILIGANEAGKNNFPAYFEFWLINPTSGVLLEQIDDGAAARPHTVPGLDNSSARRQGAAGRGSRPRR